MKKLVLCLIVTCLIPLISASTIYLGFRDLGTTTQNAVFVENSSYPVPTDESYSRWFVQGYKSIDNFINPLNQYGQPTGDDCLITNIGGTGSLEFNFNGSWNCSTNLQCLDPVLPLADSLVYHSSGDKIYFRIFNSKNVATATKYMQGTSLYNINNTYSTWINYIPIYGWSPWIVFRNPITGFELLPLYPINEGININYTNVILTWHCNTGGVPTGYKVYLDTSASLQTLIQQNGSTQCQIDSLLPNTTYYWKIIPFNYLGDGINFPVWSFTTKEVYIQNYTVYISSIPSGANIFIDGSITQFFSPHLFIMIQGSNTDYSVQKNGYTWQPTNFVINNITANCVQTFSGSQGVQNIVNSPIIFPNPNGGSFYICKSNISSDTISIYNIRGNKIKFFKIWVDADNCLVKMPNNITSGMYYVQINNVYFKNVVIIK